MQCPFCGNSDTRVIDSRMAGADGDQVRRRRQCPSCEARFTTYEVAELNLPRIVKSDGRREVFSDEKLRGGMLRALEKRAVSMDAVENAMANVKRRLREHGDREISSRQVGEWVMGELRELDEVAYVRFASVYHSFEDIGQFLEAINRLENEMPPELKKQQLNLIPSERERKKR
jgi:transcriptional repressor NrdR